MTRPEKPAVRSSRSVAMVVALVLLGTVQAAAGLESDQDQPLDVEADFTDGTLGDGTAVLKGNVVVRRGTLLVKADLAEIEKAEGKVRLVTLTGTPVHLEQEIENEGRVQARANRVEYQVASGIVILSGDADVVHPQYHITGEMLQYDLNLQHFQGIGGDQNGRIKIRMDPEVVPDLPHESGNSDVSTESSSEASDKPDESTEPDETANPVVSHQGIGHAQSE